MTKFPTFQQTLPPSYPAGIFLQQIRQKLPKFDKKRHAGKIPACHKFECRAPLIDAASTAGFRSVQLRPGTPAAHTNLCLVLLSSEPDTVHSAVLHRTQPSSPSDIAPDATDTDLSKGIKPRCSGLRVTRHRWLPVWHGKCENECHLTIILHLSKLCN